MNTILSSPYFLAAASLIGVCVGAGLYVLVILAWDEVQYRKLDKLAMEDATRRAQNIIDSWKR